MGRPQDAIVSGAFVLVKPKDGAIQKTVYIIAITDLIEETVCVPSLSQGICT